LKTYLHQACSDRVDALFITGAYNPFIRTYPFPPVHINLNYLIDPRQMAFDYQYKGLYDEQTEGPAMSRADGLVLPGVAQVVFHPNQHPRPKDETSWWQTLVDFYRSDDTAEEED
jgi:hypothetical protein